MKNRVQWVVLGAVVVGIVLALATNQYFDKHRNSEDALAKQIETLLKPSNHEFQAHKPKPSVEAMKGLQEAAELNPSGPKAVWPQLDQWLRRMRVNGSDSSEFQDLAVLMLKVDPETPTQFVKALRTPLSQSDKLYREQMLVTFGKPAVNAVAAACEEDAREARGDFHVESKNVFPRVLAAMGDDARPALHDALKSPYPSVRRQALRALAMMVPDRANEARADIEAVLKEDDDRSVRAFAALTLGELASKDKGSASARVLQNSLNDSDPHVRLTAARALGRPEYHGADRGQVAQTLLRLLESNAFASVDLVGKEKSWWDVERWAPDIAMLRIWKKGNTYTPLYWDEATAHVLLQLGPNNRPSIERILSLLRSCPHDGRHLVTMLAAHGERASSAVPALITMLKDPADSRQRRKALIALGTLGKAANEAIPEIQAALKHPDGTTRWQAFLALVRLNPEAAKESVPLRLHNAVNVAAGSLRDNKYTNVSQWTACVWRDCAPILVPVISANSATDASGQIRTPTDQDILTENDCIDRMLAELERTDTLGNDAVPLLQAAFEGTLYYANTPVRHPQRALALLAREGSAAEPAVPHIIRAWPRFEKDKDEVGTALIKIGEVAVPHLAKELDSRQVSLDQQVRILELLTVFGPKAKAAIPSLLTIINWEEETTKDRATRTAEAYERLASKAVVALGNLGAAGSAAVPGLRPLLKHDRNEVRRHAANALGLIGPPAKDALPDLIGLFQSDSRELRVVAERAVSRFGKDAVQLLTTALESSNEDVRLSAVNALAMLRPEDARPALPALQRVVGGEQVTTVRLEAQELVKKLEPR